MRQCRQSDVGQMLVDFPFPYADGLGNLPGGHLFVIQKEEDFLADGLGTASIVHDHPVMSESQHYPSLWICPCSMFSQSSLTSNIPNVKEGNC